jgi:hypothetical protein
MIFYLPRVITTFLLGCYISCLRILSDLSLIIFLPVGAPVCLSYYRFNINIFRRRNSYLFWNFLTARQDYSTVGGWGGCYYFTNTFQLIGAGVHFTYLIRIIIKENAAVKF